MKRLLFLICTLLCLHGVSSAQNCRALYMYGASNPVNPLTVSFYDSSYVTNGGTVTFWEWGFGDGTSSHDQNPVHTYSAAGNYTVCLTIRDTFNGIACANYICDTIQVGNVPNTCSVGYQYTAGANLGQINFYSYTTGSNLTYAWRFGDGGTSAGINPVHQYASNGRYQACVIITAHDNAGNAVCTSDFCDSVTVTNASSAPCAANFTVSTQSIYTAFNSTSTGTTNNTIYTWDFGDNTTGHLASENHGYPGPGTYVACLTITNTSGGLVTCTSQHCDTIVIPVPNNTCSTSFQYSVQPNGSIYFYASAQATNGYVSWAYQYGDGDTSGAQFNNSRTHTYARPGWYLACVILDVHDTSGNIVCTTTHCDSVFVPAANPCTVGFQYVQTPNGLVANFTATGTGSNLSYEWAFGDNTTAPNSTSNTVSHTYNHDGWYIVCVYAIAHDANGTATCTASHCDSVLIQGSTPPRTCHAAFTSSTANNTALGISFINGSAGASNTTQAYYTWSFGDSTFSHLANPQHTYASAGTYRVCLTITTYGVNGAIVCADDTCANVTISTPNPVNCSAAFQYTAGSNPNDLQFQEYASGSNLTYAWNFGDGSTGTGHDPHHVYAHPGYYLVCLTVTNASGGAIQCTATHCDSVQVSSPTTTQCGAAFQYIQSTANGNNIHFVNSSRGSGHLSYLWSFGDGDSSSQINPNHVYAQGGYYLVCLTIVDYAANGVATCTGQFCDSVFVGNTLPTGPYTLSGTVFNGPNQNSINAIVYLITLDSFNLVAVDSVLAPQGLYTFTNVRGGQYLIKAALRVGAPHFTDFLPTYYGDELFWLDGTLLTVAQNISSLDIHLLPGLNNGGPGFIGGNIFQGANKTADVGDPLAGYQVMILNMDNTPVQYVYSDAAGEFNFSNLAYGTYKLYTEVLGKATEPAIFTISATGETGRAAVYVGSELVTAEKLTGIETVGSNITATNLYPNPVTTSATVTFNAATESTVTISLTNVMGQQVLDTKLNVSAGSNTYSLDMTGMAQGVYILQIRDNNSKGSIFKIVKD